MNAWIESAILGLVQGLTEFLPISSSGHLIAAKEIIGSEAGLAFDIALHVATLVAVVLYFRGDLIAIARHHARFRIASLLAIGTVPGAALGAALSGWRDGIGPWWVVGGWSFSALYLIASRGRGGERRWVDFPLSRGLLVGCAQALAIFPGVSRSGSTIACGLWMGLSPDAACRFSFLLAVPLIAGAGLKKALDLRDSGTQALGDLGPLALGMVVAFAVGLVAIHWLLRLVRSGVLHRFGWYNLGAAIAFAAFLLLRA